LFYSLVTRSLITGSPCIDDLDNNGLLDLVIAASDYSGGFGNARNKMIITRRVINSAGGSHWNGVMGNRTDGCWQEDIVISANEPAITTSRNIRISPNPFIGELKIHLPQDNNFIEEAALHLYALDGRELMTAMVFLDGAGEVQVKGLDFIPAGIYRLTIEINDGAVFSTPVVKIQR
jgi:hypothetical protein